MNRNAAGIIEPLTGKDLRQAERAWKGLTWRRIVAWFVIALLITAGVLLLVVLIS